MVIIHNYIWPACTESLIYSVGNTYIDKVYMVFLVSPESSYGLIAQLVPKSLKFRARRARARHLPLPVRELCSDSGASTLKTRAVLGFVCQR